MFTFLGEFEEAAGDLYPYRWPISITAVVVLAAFALFAWRMRWHRWVWGHRVAATVIVAPVLAVAVLIGSYTLPPLWERSRLDEASPLAMATPATGAGANDGATGGAPSEAGAMPDAESGVAFMARVTRRGMFDGADEFHFGRGDALLIETAPGTYTLRFENFSVRNGPDLFVYLTNDPDDVSEAVNLGSLKATDGNFNYDVPAGVDPTSYAYAIVWCRDFAVLFATAPLTAA